MNIANDKKVEKATTSNNNESLSKIDADYKAVSEELNQIKQSPIYSVFQYGKKLGRLFDEYKIYSANTYNAYVETANLDVGKYVELLSQSVLFDAKYYKSQLERFNIKVGIKSGANLVEHYLTKGWKFSIEPSHFFDSEYVLSQLADTKNTNICPLIQFLDRWKEESLSPNILFDTKSYLAVAGGYNVADPVSHYLSEQPEFKIDFEPSILFDEKFYFKAYPEAIESGLTAWCHYLTIGRYENKLPNQLFDPSFYRTQVSDLVSKLSDCLKLIEHFQTVGYRENVRPHTNFDVQFYKELVGKKDEEFNYLEHILTEGRKNNFLCNPKFYEDLAAFEKNAVTEVDSSIKQEYFDSLYCNNLELSTYAKVKELKESGTSSIIFVGHEASLTGAPMVLLSLVKQFKRKGYHCFVVLQKGGELLDEFEENSTVILCENFNQPESIAEVFSYLVSDLIASNQIFACVANTVQVVDYLTIFKSAGLPIVTLCHEIADSYTKEHFRKLYDSTNELVFSSEFSFGQAKQKAVPPDAVNVHVKAQGLLDSNFGSIVQNDARKKIRKELELDDDACIVLSCGSIDLRKGIDNFVQIAHTLYTQYNEDLQRPLVFVWIGDGFKYSGTPYYYANWDIEQMQLQDKVKILPPQEDLESWFVGADLFLLPSRQDPLPCVVHNAMASQLPIIAFQNSGGTQEMLKEGGGKLVPYGSIQESVDGVIHYYSNEKERKLEGKKGREIALEKHEFSEYYFYIEQLIEKYNYKLKKQAPCYVDTKAEKIKTEIDFLEGRLRAILKSRSWKYTGWIRYVRKVLGVNNTPFGFKESELKEHIQDSPELYASYLRKLLFVVRTSRSWKLSKALRLLAGECRQTYRAKINPNQTGEYEVIGYNSTQ